MLQLLELMELGEIMKKMKYLREKSGGEVFLERGSTTYERI